MGQELEVKFFVGDLAAVEARLKDMGAKPVQVSTYEINLRFDTSEGELSSAFRVLRLRQDTAARLTYKGPSVMQEGVRVRQEIEFEVDDFESAQALLEALGYQVVMIYEKYRAVYEFEGVLITLDKMPYGQFVEIEGPEPASIHRVNQRLGLDWGARVPDSYTALFEKLRLTLGLAFRDLSFANFKDQDYSLEILGIRQADSA